MIVMAGGPTTGGWSRGREPRAELSIRRSLPTSPQAGQTTSPELGVSMRGVPHSTQQGVCCVLDSNESCCGGRCLFEEVFSVRSVILRRPLPPPPAGSLYGNTTLRRDDWT